MKWKVKAHHQAMGTLFDSGIMSEEDYNGLKRENNKYRAIMAGIRLASLAQAFHIGAMYKSGRSISKIIEVGAFMRLFGTLLGGDYMNYYYYHRKTEYYLRKYGFKMQ